MGYLNEYQDNHELFSGLSRSLKSRLDLSISLLHL